jgi:3-oxoadipate CoA-transferase beta subunit
MDQQALAYEPLDDLGMAARVAQDIPEGWYVNLGVGMPTKIADYVPTGREVIFHSENGILGMGPAPEGEPDPWLVNAGKQPVTLIPGSALFHQAESFGMIRGQHLDLCVLGAFEVAQNGDVANWITNSTDVIPGIGGAMDLVVGARRVWVVMSHVTKHGTPKLVRECSYPLTARGAITRVYTDLAVIDVTAEGFELIEMRPGLTFDELQAKTGAPLHRKHVHAA